MKSPNQVERPHRLRRVPGRSQNRHGHEQLDRGNPEEKILERFNVQPGDLYRTIENAKWLLHAIEELSPVVAKNKEVTALSTSLLSGFLKA